MTAFSDYLEDQIINRWLRNTAGAGVPANVYVSLHSADPGDTGASELSGNAYARVAVSTTGGFSAPAAGATENAAEILFPVATPAGQGTATHFGIWDAATVGNLLFRGVLTASKVIATGDRFRFGPGTLDIALD